MRSTPALRAALAALAATCALGAQAARVAGQTGSRPTDHPRAASPAASSGSLALIAGTVTAVDRKARTFTVSGQAVGWEEGRVQVFTASGAPSTVDRLAPGSRIRFALRPGSSPRQAALIYLDGQP